MGSAWIIGVQLDAVHGLFLLSLGSAWVIGVKLGAVHGLLVSS